MEERSTMMKRLILLAVLLTPFAAHAEPVTAAVAAFAAWAGVTVATVYLVAAVVVLSTGMAVYGAAQARRAERDAKDARNAAMQDRMTNRIAAESPHRYVYGRAKAGVDIVAMFTSGDKDQYKHIVCVLAAHECDAVEEVYINNVAVGLLNSSGDATTGRFAPIPGTEVTQEQKTGPTFTLSKYPVGAVQAFALQGLHYVEVAVTAQSGRNITIASSGSVIVNYQYNVGRRFGDAVDETVSVANSPYVRVQIHLGGPTDPADAYLMSVVPSKWTSTSVLRGLCYLVVTLDLNNPEFQGGPVPIHALVRGRKLYDPRTGLTAWSQNPALGTMDYLTSPLCGVSLSDLPVAQYITAANVCDETSVAGGLYTMNGTVTSAESQTSALESMAQCMAGGIVSTTWDIYAGKYIAPVIALDQSDIVGALSITPGASDAAIYNGVKGQFISPDNSYVMTDFAPFQNPAYLAADGRDLYTDIPFPFTDSLQRVHNLARIFTEDMRNGFTMKAEFSLKAWPIKVGQRVTFTSAFLGQSSKVYRVTDKSYAPNSAVELTLKEDDASIWDFADAVTVDSTPNTNLPDPWAIAPLASLSCTSGVATLLTQADGSIVPRILVTWPVATTQSVFTNGQIEIEWRAISTETWQKTIVSGDATETYLSPITPGYFYVIRARAVNPYLNTKSGWVITTYQVAVSTASPTVYKWAPDMPALPSGAGSYAWPTGLFGAAPSGWSLTEPAPPTGGDSTLWSASVLVSDISVAGSTPFDWGSATIAAIGYAPPPSSAGPTGGQTAVARLYQWSSSAPAAPTGTSTHTWATGIDSAYSASDGWTIAAASNPGTPLIRLYVAEKPIAAAGTVTTSTVSYSGASISAWSQNGDTGPSGVQSAIATVYQWAATIPAGPSGSPTWTWATQSFGASPSGYSLTPGTAPSPGYTLWGASVRVTDSASNATTGFNWSAAAVMAMGYAGSNGGPGAEGASYVTAYCASATASTTTAPSATTGRTSLPATNSGGLTGTYSATVPTLTSGQFMYQTDGIYNPATDQITWSIPYWSSLKVATLSAITANLGAITAGSIDIGTGTTSWHVDTSGNTWAGASTYAAAPYRVSNAGVALLKSATFQTSGGATVLDATGLQAGYEAPGTKNSDIGLGVNLIPANSLPTSVSGFTAASSSGAYTWEGPIFDANSIYSPGGVGSVYTHVVAVTPAAGTYIAVYKDAGATYPVLAGRRYEFSAAVSAHRCSGTVVAVWYDASHTYISDSVGNAITVGHSNTTAPVDFPRSYVFATAPVGAAYVMVQGTQTHNGAQADPYVFYSQWYVGEAGATQTVPTKWADAPTGVTTAIADKLSRTSASSLAATVTVTTGGSILSGTTTNGTYQSPSGFFGVQGGVVKFSVPISGDPTFAGQLSAAYGSFGAVTIAVGGSLSSGQTAYNTGTGFWIQGGTSPKISTKAANGAAFLCDPANNVLTMTGATISQPVLDAFSLSGTFGGSASGANGSPLVVSLSASASGGTAPYKFNWTFSKTAGGPSSVALTPSAVTGASLSVSCSAATNLYVTGLATCTCIDTNGRSLTQTSLLEYTFGTA